MSHPALLLLKPANLILQMKSCERLCKFAQQKKYLTETMEFNLKGVTPSVH